MISAFGMSAGGTVAAGAGSAERKKRAAKKVTVKSAALAVGK
jgi:hypothetical protein